MIQQPKTLKSMNLYVEGHGFAGIATESPPKAAPS